MKIKYIVYSLFVVSLMASCKSKKRATQKKSKITKAVVTKPRATTSIQNKTVAYIEQFKQTAMKEMRSHKIPASITLAQGILESRSGQSQLTMRSNNHFGIKCHKGWNGKKVYYDDDAKGECFRKYKDPAKSFKDHSLFLTGRSRYANLFKLGKGDYIGWAKGLSKAGYATDRRYPAKLIALIEKYDLHIYDTQVLGKKIKSKPKKVNYNSVTNYAVIKGDTLYSISKKYGLTVDELKSLNNLNSNDLAIGQVLRIKK